MNLPRFTNIPILPRGNCVCTKRHPEKGRKWKIWLHRIDRYLEPCVVLKQWEKALKLETSVSSIYWCVSFDTVLPTWASVSHRKCWNPTPRLLRGHKSISRKYKCFINYIGKGNFQNEETKLKWEQKNPNLSQKLKSKAPRWLERRFLGSFGEGKISAFQHRFTKNSTEPVFIHCWYLGVYNAPWQSGNMTNGKKHWFANKSAEVHILVLTPNSMSWSKLKDLSEPLLLIC